MRVVSIPRMELTVAVLAAGLTEYIRRELLMEVKSVPLWTYSIIVLRFIRETSNEIGMSVVNRLSSIHDLSNPDYWWYVDTKSNPADLTYQGMYQKG
ncbi:uncharacterized protein DEA37_0001069 [Paragonimus westermani]|uniref:Uncharacterized protein n=1 Tax=Paragonimus westermani TaxID=34504 RepID=A0A5J4NRS9_9TREM|nr:uncharacterized protein DEA37_0001069 [Paragonimus westermani]